MEEAVTVSVIVNPCVLEMALDPFLRLFHLEQFGLLSKDLGVGKSVPMVPKMLTPIFSLARMLAVIDKRILFSSKRNLNNN